MTMMASDTVPIVSYDERRAERPPCCDSEPSHQRS
eukprot:CAMPEP_0178507986 /NCGR_PEP_ID=MMETSP0696-20121128/20509_1 /TAXON_ID=265572 /ORGANISM="Extubocellulus spinifer, Strain CCMP396" /LENGTH=34 /DNA_ID= /DNA_START= /DNA_END= /DNA_ORIENTATION=